VAYQALCGGKIPPAGARGASRKRAVYQHHPKLTLASSARQQTHNMQLPAQEMQRQHVKKFATTCRKLLPAR
jgi:hypothetical protein